ncbi:hypothetical protein JHW43_009588 [Diplocarpon mali]|nr:hypothetical protein JHW43_009588 [Diplocarpon mali]
MPKVISSSIPQPNSNTCSGVPRQHTPTNAYVESRGDHFAKVVYKVRKHDTFEEEAMAKRVRLHWQRNAPGHRGRERWSTNGHRLRETVRLEMQSLPEGRAELVQGGGTEQQRRLEKAPPQMIHLEAKLQATEGVATARTESFAGSPRERAGRQDAAGQNESTRATGDVRIQGQALQKLRAQGFGGTV